MHTEAQLISSALDGYSCGITLDVFSGNLETAQVQWIAGVPLDSFQRSNESELVERVLSRIARVGFVPDGDSPTNLMSLENGYSRESDCPFRPGYCTGDHLVFSGRGFIETHATS